MRNFDKELNDEIRKIHSAFKKEKPYKTIPLETKENYMKAILHEISISAIKKSTFYPDLLNEEKIQHYSERYEHCLYNHLQSIQIYESLETIDKETFFLGWKDFTEKLTQNSIEIGEKTTLLRNLVNTYKTSIRDTVAPYQTSYNKRERFWQNYVQRENILSRKKHMIYKQELPLYYILYTIYCCQTFCNEEPFPNFGIMFQYYRKQTHINPILTWCVLCFYEWYAFLKKTNCKDNINSISSYIAGISTFLEHFGFYWHYGLNYQEHHLSRLFKNYRYTGSKDDICFTFQNSEDFLRMHHLYTQEMLTIKPLFNKARIDERQQLMATETSYIADKLAKYFLLPKDRFSKYLKYNGPTEYLIIKSSSHNMSDEKRTKEIALPDNVKFLELRAREVFASLFLALSRTENDLLAFINTQLNFDCIINALGEANLSSKDDTVIFLENDVQTEPESTLEMSSSTELLWLMIQIIVISFENITTQSIYNDYLIPKFKEAKDKFPFPQDEWFNYINEQYISSLITFCTQADSYEKF